MSVSSGSEMSEQEQHGQQEVIYIHLSESNESYHTPQFIVINGPFEYMRHKVAFRHLGDSDDEPELSDSGSEPNVVVEDATSEIRQSA